MCVDDMVDFFFMFWPNSLRISYEGALFAQHLHQARRRQLFGVCVSRNTLSLVVNQERLIECGWRDDLKARCRAILKRRGLANVTGATTFVEIN